MLPLAVGVWLFATAAARPDMVDQCLAHRSGTGACLQTIRSACYREHASQAASSRCAAAIDKRVFDTADDAIGQRRLDMDQSRYAAWKTRQTTICDATIPFDRGGSGYGQAMDDCMADATLSLIKASSARGVR